MDVLDWISLGVSIVAIVVSVIVAVCQYKVNKKNNAIGLESDICFKIYYDYLVRELPEAREYILYSNGILSDTDKMTKVLNKIRRSSLFFKYRDAQYYDELVDKLRDMEDFLVNAEGEMSQEKFVHFFKTLNEKMEDLYQTIMKECSGMRKR